MVWTKGEWQEPNQNFEVGRFSGFVWAHQAHGFPLLDLLLDIVDSNLVCVVVISILNGNHWASILAK